MIPKNRKEMSNNCTARKSRKNDRFSERETKIPRKIHENAKKTLSIDNFLNESLKVSQTSQTETSIH